MSQYEITFLLNEDKELAILKELVASYKGKVLKEDDWGVKELSYPIKKITSAHFYNWQFEMKPLDVTNFKRKLNFNEKLIRYLILSVEEEKK